MVMPSYVALRQGERKGKKEGFNKGYSSAKNKYYRQIVTPAFEERIRQEVIKEFEKNIKKRELDKLETQLSKKLTKEITIELLEKSMKKVEEEITKLNKGDFPVLLPNLNIIVDRTRGVLKPEDYAREKFEKMGWKCEDCRLVGGGHPDYTFTKGLRRIYVEVKSFSDGLRLSQAEWIMDNKDKRVIIYFV